MTEPTIVLHIGAHKTASSLLQSAARDDRLALRDAGLRYVLRNKIVDNAFYPVLGSILAGETPTAKDVKRSSRGFAKLTGRSPLTLISDEDLFGKLHPTEFFPHTEQVGTFLRDLAPSARMRVVLYTRCQADYLESIYIQRIQLGRSLPWKRFIRRWEDVDLSWRRVVADLGTVFGPENVTVMPYESIRRSGPTGFYRTFLGAAGLDRPERFAIDESLSVSRSANRSYSDVAVRMALAANALLEPEDRVILRKFLQENFSTATHPRAVLFADEDRAELLRTYRDDNQRLFDDHMPAYEAERDAYLG